MLAISTGYPMISGGGQRRCVWVMASGATCGSWFDPSNPSQEVCPVHSMARARAVAQERRMLNKPESADSANNITNDILVALNKEFPDQCKVWRRNTGGGYPVKTVQVALSMLRRGSAQECERFLATARPITFGMPGEGDIDGILSIHGAGVRINIEVKAGKDKQRESQAVCEEVFRKLGAIYILARSVEDAVDGVRRALHLVGGHS